MTLIAFDVETHKIQPGLKACADCGEEKPRTQFYARRSRKGGLQHRCIACCAQLRKTAKAKARAKELYHTPHRAEARQRYRLTPRGKWVKAEQTLRERYGITSEDWARMYESQRGRCACCGDRLKMDPSTHVDHDHDSGLVRALVCRGCNIKIGVLESHKFRFVSDYLARARR